MRERDRVGPGPGDVPDVRVLSGVTSAGTAATCERQPCTLGPYSGDASESETCAGRCANLGVLRQEMGRREAKERVLLTHWPKRHTGGAFFSSRKRYLRRKQSEQQVSRGKCAADKASH